MAKVADPLLLHSLIGLSAVAVVPSPPPAPTYGGGLSTITAKPLYRDVLLGPQQAVISIIAVGHLEIVRPVATGHLRLRDEIEIEDAILLGLPLPEEPPPGSELEDLWVWFLREE